MTKVNWHKLLFVLCPVYTFQTGMMFQKLALFPFSGKEASNLADPLDLAALSHWELYTQYP